MTLADFFNDLRAVMVGATGGLLIWALSLIRAAFKRATDTDAQHDLHLAKHDLEIESLRRDIDAIERTLRHRNARVLPDTDRNNAG